jgi:hypothetical protein
MLPAAAACPKANPRKSAAELDRELGLLRTGVAIQRVLEVERFSPGR